MCMKIEYTYIIYIFVFVYLLPLQDNIQQRKVQGATRKWNRNRKSTDSRADKDNTGCCRVAFPFPFPSLWYLWQPSCAAQTILCRLFVCFAHLNCCSFNIHSHAEVSSSVSGCGAPRPRVDIQIFSIDRFHNFPLSYLFLFLFFFWLLAMAQNWSAFLLLIVHSLSRSFAAFATLLLYLLLLLYIAHIFLLRLSGNWCVKLWLGLSSVPQQIVV